MLELTRRRALDSLDVGYNMAVHIGHGFRNVMSLGDSNATNADFQSLTNGNRLTNMYAVDCTSNAIDYPCIGESVHEGPDERRREQHRLHTAGLSDHGARVPEGILPIRCSRPGVTSVGEAQGRQKLPFVANAVTDNTHRWTQMTMLLLGDPEMHLWTQRPRALTVAKPASIAASDTTLTVNVAAGGAPLAGALVTAYKANDDYESGTTDASGNVTLGFRPDDVGAVTLTVTAINCVPYQVSIPITAAAGPLLVEGTIAVDDDKRGWNVRQRRDRADRRGRGRGSHDSDPQHRWDVVVVRDRQAHDHEPGGHHHRGRGELRDHRRGCHRERQHALPPEHAVHGDRSARAAVLALDGGRREPPLRRADPAHAARPRAHELRARLHGDQLGTATASRIQARTSRRR